MDRKHRFDWGRLVSWLALPFVAAAMVVVPLFGGHLCPEEVIPMLAGAASVPFIGPAARALIARLRKQQPAKVHCCDSTHPRSLAKELAEGFLVLEKNRYSPTIKVEKKELRGGYCTCTSLDSDWGAGSGFHNPRFKRDPQCPFHFPKTSAPFIVAKPDAKPLPDIDLDYPWWCPSGFPNDCQCNECGHQFTDLDTRSKSACPACGWTHADQFKFKASLRNLPGPIWSNRAKKAVACSDGHEGCLGDDAFDPSGALCRCTNIHGLHGRRISCPPQEG